MIIFGIEVEDNKEIKKFVLKMQKKLSNPDLLQNPFTGFIKYIEAENPYLLIYLNLVWINPTFAFLLLGVGLLIKFGLSLSWFHIFLIPLALGSFMFTKTFSKFALYYSMRRFGYKGKIKFMSNNHILLRLSGWDNKR